MSRNPTPRPALSILLIAAAAIVGIALLSQFWGGLEPCELCLLERWPYYAAIVIALIALILPSPSLARAALLLLALLFLASAGLGFYHAGIEYRWFAGPSSCTSTQGAAQTFEQLKAQLMNQKVVMCDQVQWSIFGVSLAGFNCLVSLVLATFAFGAWRRA
jgi:disulfide bond formation protein DsbB